VTALAISTAAQAADAAESGVAAPAPTARLHRPAHARDPAAELARRLDLDAKQRSQVTRLLAVRQAQIRHVWNDPAVEADDRVGAVKAINDRTVRAIRALLSEEQRAKYIQAPPPGGPASGPQPSVEDWLNASKSKNSDAGAPR